jgi:hypothetical protein
MSSFARLAPLFSFIQENMASVSLLSGALGLAYFSVSFLSDLRRQNAVVEEETLSVDAGYWPNLEAETALRVLLTKPDRRFIVVAGDTFESSNVANAVLMEMGHPGGWFEFGKRCRVMRMNLAFLASSSCRQWMKRIIEYNETDSLGQLRKLVKLAHRLWSDLGAAEEKHSEAEVKDDEALSEFRSGLRHLALQLSTKTDIVLLDGIASLSPVLEKDQNLSPEAWAAFVGFLSHVARRVTVVTTCTPVFLSFRFMSLRSLLPSLDCVVIPPLDAQSARAHFEERSGGSARFDEVARIVGTSKADLCRAADALLVNPHMDAAELHTAILTPVLETLAMYRRGGDLPAHVTVVLGTPSFDKESFTAIMEALYLSGKPDLPFQLLVECAKCTPPAVGSLVRYDILTFTSAVPPRVGFRSKAIMKAWEVLREGNRGCAVTKIEKDAVS